jgi:hypothetical protein
VQPAWIACSLPGFGSFIEFLSSVRMFEMILVIVDRLMFATHPLQEFAPIPTAKIEFNDWALFLAARAILLFLNCRCGLSHSWCG